MAKKAIEPVSVKDICRRMKNLRKELGFATAKEFAESLGLNYTTYRNYEDSRVPPPEVLAAIKSEYPDRVDVSWILTGIKDQAPPDPAVNVDTEEIVRMVVYVLGSKHPLVSELVKNVQAIHGLVVKSKNGGADDRAVDVGRLISRIASLPHFSDTTSI